jgi:hypothetical protein
MQGAQRVHGHRILARHITGSRRQHGRQPLLLLLDTQPCTGCCCR